MPLLDTSEPKLLSVSVPSGVRSWLCQFDPTLNMSMPACRRWRSVNRKFFESSYPNPRNEGPARCPCLRSLTCRDRRSKGVCVEPFRGRLRETTGRAARDIGANATAKRAAGLVRREIREGVYAVRNAGRKR